MEIKINHIAKTNIDDKPSAMGDSGYIVGNINNCYHPWPPRDPWRDGCWPTGPGDYPMPDINPWPTPFPGIYPSKSVEDYLKENYMQALPQSSKITQIDSNTRSLEVKVPGYKPEEISVTVNGNVIEIVATTQRKGFFDSVSIIQQLERNENVESADLEHGMLTIILKSKGEKTKKIPIKTK